MPEPAKTRVCDNCGRWVDEEELLYSARLDIWAEAKPPEIDLEKTGEELQEEWDDLVRRLEQLSDEDANEAIDQVHEVYEFILCPECRQELHKRVRRGKAIL